MATSKKAVITTNLAVLALVLLAASATWAHGGEKHVLGTVKTTSADSIAVATAKGTVTVLINAQTKFIHDGQPSSAASLKVGERVVIHAKEDHEKLTATEVKSGGNTAPAIKKK
jgi:endo-1,4-beta-D-glucanase Y